VTALDPNDRVRPALSPTEFRHLIEGSARALADGRVGAVFASTAGSRDRPGPTWISVTSEEAYGRIIRRGDGGFACTAYRTRDGAQICDVQGDEVCREDFDDLIAAVACTPRDLTMPGR
jgi:hypothetical protein